MMRKFTLIGSSLLVLSACSGESANVTERVTTLDVAEEAMADAAMEAPPPPQPSIARSSADVPASEIPVGLPQIAYVYSHGFRVAAPRIAALQQQHADMCEAKGPRVCRIISMQNSGSEGDYVYGSLQLAVAASQARSFGKELSAAAEGAEGELVSSSIEGEDLSKQIVDTEARLRARTLLRDRLMEVLATRRGTVKELVEAERSVAQVNEEIDQATSWLAEMRGRVAFSRVNISYQSGQPESGGFMEPVRGALGSISSILGNMVAAAIILLVVLLPIGLVAWGFARVGRKLGWRWRKAPATKTPPAEESEN